MSETTKEPGSAAGRRTTLDWQRSSWKSVVAHVGELSVEVVRTADRTATVWRVGEVVGQHHHGDTLESIDIYEVQLRAEAVARSLLREAAKAMGMIS